MKKLILVGGGHAHLFVLKQLQQKTIKDVEVTLISSHAYQYYSGMFSGYAEGIYKSDDLRVDLEELANKTKVNWKEGTVLSIDPNQKVILTEKGEVISFDVISFDIGSLTAGINAPGVMENGTTIKPNYHFTKVMEDMRTSENLVIVGGGAAGVEISLSLQAWRTKQGIKSPVTLVSSGDLLSNETRKVSKRIEHIVRGKGIHLKKDTKIDEVKSRSLVTSSNNEISFNKLLWLTGPKAPELFKLAKLPVDEQGYLLVENTLQVKKYPFIFGAGDCITIKDHPDLPKIGVYAVKEGPVLYKNLVGYFETGEGEKFIPQKRFLSILSTGDKEGFLLYNGHAFFGKWAWYLKNKIDRRFIREFQ